MPCTSSNNYANLEHQRQMKVMRFNIVYLYMTVIIHAKFTKFRPKNHDCFLYLNHHVRSLISGA